MKNVLPVPTKARYIRFIPTAYKKWPVLRVDVFGWNVWNVKKAVIVATDLVIRILHHANCEIHTLFSFRTLKIFTEQNTITYNGQNIRSWRVLSVCLIARGSSLADDRSYKASNIKLCYFRPLDIEFQAIWLVPLLIYMGLTIYRKQPQNSNQNRVYKFQPRHKTCLNCYRLLLISPVL